MPQNNASTDEAWYNIPLYIFFVMFEEKQHTSRTHIETHQVVQEGKKDNASKKDETEYIIPLLFFPDMQQKNMWKHT